MNRSKKLAILCGVLAVACIAALVALHTNEKQEEIQTNGETVLSVDPDQVTALSWTYDGATLSFHRDDGTWVYDDDADFPVSADAMDTLLAPFESFGAAFTIENADDLSQYGLDDPTCTITLTAGEETYTIKLGDYSAMDSQRYVDIGDGSVYLAASDPLDTYDTELKDLIENDTVPDFDEVTEIAFSGSAEYTLVHDEDADSLCKDDEYFTTAGEALDTDRVDSYLSTLRYLSLTDYTTYTADEEALAAYGLDNPELSVRVEYVDEDGNAGTFLLQLSRDPAELQDTDSDSADEEDASEITAYARVGDSKIVYTISGSSYQSLMKASYNDLRHQTIFTGDFSEATGIDVTLDGESYTLTSKKDGKERTWLYQDEEIDIDDLQSALEDLTAEEFTDESAAAQQEISLTVHLDNEDYPDVTFTFYRYNGSQCLACVDGESVAYVPRSEVVSLTEAVRAVVLN